MWYYFRLHKINNDGSMEMHLEEVGVFQPDASARRLSETLHDLPGGTCLWHGYVDAEDRNAAEVAVAANY